MNWIEPCCWLAQPARWRAAGGRSYPFRHRGDRSRRNTARLDVLARRLGPLFAVEPLDRSTIDTACLNALRARWPGLFAVADASGPFQTSDDRLPRAAIGAGLTMSTLPTHAPSSAASACSMAQARAANVAVLAGASSTPALSHAVLDTLVAGSRKVIAIEVAIAPGNRAPRGLSVVQAVLSTVGRPIRPVSRLSLDRGRWMGTEQNDRTSRRGKTQGRAVRNTRPRPAR